MHIELVGGVPTYSYTLFNSKAYTIFKNFNDDIDNRPTYFSVTSAYPEKEKDSSLRAKLKNNILLLKDIMLKKNIPLNINISESNKPFDEEMIEFAKSVDADLIAIVNTLKWNMFGGLLSRREQEIITNKEQIPVLCVNPIDVKTGYTM